MEFFAFDTRTAVLANKIEQLESLLVSEAGILLVVFCYAGRVEDEHVHSV